MENEDKLLLAHTLGMDIVMGKDIYPSELRSMSISGCSNDNMSSGTGDQLISLGSEYNKHLYSVVIDNLNKYNSNISISDSIYYINFSYKYLYLVFYHFNNSLNDIQLNKFINHTYINSLFPNNYFTLVLYYYISLLINTIRCDICILNKIISQLDPYISQLYDIYVYLRKFIMKTLNIIHIFQQGFKIKHRLFYIHFNQIQFILSTIKSEISILGSSHYSIRRNFIRNNKLSITYVISQLESHINYLKSIQLKFYSIRINVLIIKLKSIINDPYALIPEMSCIESIEKMIHITSAIKNIESLISEIDKHIICISNCKLYLSNMTLMIKRYRLGSSRINQAEIRSLDELKSKLCNFIGYSNNVLSHLRQAKSLISKRDLINYIITLLCKIDKMTVNFDSIYNQNNKCSTLNYLDQQFLDMEDLLKHIDLDKYDLIGLRDNRILESKFIIKQLLNSSEIYNKILRVIDEADRCVCVRNVSNKDENYKFHITGFYSNIHGDKKITFDLVSKMVKVGNDHCLCMVIKYILYPMIYKCINYIINRDNDFINTINRSFNKIKYFNNHNISTSNIFYLVLILIYKISVEMQNRYLSAFSNIQPIADLYCFCRAPRDKYYLYYIIIILVLSFLIENIWSMDTESVRIDIENLSTLMSEFDIMCIEDNKSNFKSINIKLLNPFKRCDKYKNISDEIYYYFQCIKESFECMKNDGNDKITNKYEFSVQISMNNHITSPNKTIYIQLEFIYPNNLMKMCENNKCKDKKLCKCGMVKIYELSILMSNINSKLKSKMNIIKELLNTLEVMVRIVKEINNTSLNKIKLVKNNYITSNSHVSTKNIGVTNVETRNWGYYTRYEHDVTNDKGFSNQYPYVTNRDNSYSMSSNSNVRSNKRFKMILSRLLVGGVIVLVFLYLRVSYQQFILVYSVIVFHKYIIFNIKFFI